MTFWQTYYHLIWATKEREPLITPEIEQRLYPYLVTRAGELGVFVFALNGTADHIHLVASIPPSQSVSHVVHLFKGASAHMLNHPHEGLHFAWQRTYGVLTLGHRQVPQAIAYVRSQKEHHRLCTTNARLERDDAPTSGPTEYDPMTPAQTVLRDSNPIDPGADVTPF